MKHEDQIDAPDTYNTVDNTNMTRADIRLFEPTNINTQHSSIEVINILPTCTENLFQILAKNQDEKIFLVCTWDFVKNIEHSMF